MPEAVHPFNSSLLDSVALWRVFVGPCRQLPCWGCHAQVIASTLHDCCALLHHMQVVQVDMMSRTFKARDMQGTSTIRYAEVAGQYRAVHLPYKGSAGLAAVFVLPDSNKYKSVFDAATTITGAAVLDRKNWATLFDLSTLSVSVPRFKVSVSQLSMTKVSRACCAVLEAACACAACPCLCFVHAGRQHAADCVQLSARALNPNSFTGCHHPAAAVVICADVVLVPAPPDPPVHGHHCCLQRQGRRLQQGV